MRPEEPQSYRDLALVLEKRGEYERAFQLLWKVVIGKWPKRYDEIELTAAVELNHILVSMEMKGLMTLYKELINKIDKRLVFPMPCDIRVSMAWDTDLTDIDLHIRDPFGEHCFYSSPRTKSGGFISRDFTRGYGPEEFMQKKVHCEEGKFLITAKYFACHQMTLTGGTTILCSCFKNYMRQNEEKELVTIRLATNKEEVAVCEMKFDKEEEEHEEEEEEGVR